jgi:hypothetical protein
MCGDVGRHRDRSREPKWGLPETLMGTNVSAMESDISAFTWFGPLRNYLKVIFEISVSLRDQEFRNSVFVPRYAESGGNALQP